MDCVILKNAEVLLYYTQIIHNQVHREYSKFQQHLIKKILIIVLFMYFVKIKYTL